MKKKNIAGFFLMVLGLCSAVNVLAFYKVYSPIVEKGELELEYKGSTDFDHRNGFKGAGEQAFEIGYGVTDRWFTEVEASMTKDAQEENEDGETQKHHYSYEATAWENIFQLTEQGQYFVDLGFFVEYEWARLHEDRDSLTMKILLEKQCGDFIHRLNLNFEKESGGGSTQTPEPGFSWQTLYRFREEVQPGFEIHSNFGPMREQGPYQEQEHFIGPVVAGRVFGKVKYNIGYLFGLTHNTPDGELKTILEWEQRF